VNAAVLTLLQNQLERIGFAPINARVSGAEIPDSIMLLRNASTAERSLRRTSTVKLGSAAPPVQSGGTSRPKKDRITSESLRIVSVESEGKSDVCCMEVPGYDAFAIENGAVVHNCATRYGVMSLKYARTKPIEAPRRKSARETSAWAS